MTKLLLIVALLLGMAERDRIAATLWPVLTVQAQPRVHIGAVR